MLGGGALGGVSIHWGGIDWEPVVAVSNREGDASVFTALMATSESEEMYLITIAMALEDGHRGPLPVPRLAEALEVSRVSANEMVKKLAARGLVEYTPYRGAVLSVEGELVARAILRRRRLWTVFLSDRLGLTPGAADVVACEFEHVTTAEVAHRLSEFLGDPRIGPQGKSIPAAPDQFDVPEPSLRLCELSVGRSAEVVRVGGDAADRSFLAGEGVARGSVIELLALGEEGSCLVITDKGRLHLSAGVAGLVGVVPLP